jgi:hypothetical protein
MKAVTRGFWRAMLECVFGQRRSDALCVQNVTPSGANTRMSGKRQRTTFAKLQRERARMDKAAEKRARRLARKHGTDPAEAPADQPAEEPTPAADHDESQAV